MLKTVNDYLLQLYDLYPNIPKLDIKKAVEYGWRELYYYNLRGLDTLIQSRKYKYWFYCGRLTRNSVKHFQYYKEMLLRKIRTLYIRKHLPITNTYYFGLKDDEYEELTRPRKGRKKLNWLFSKKYCYLILDEARVAYFWAKYIVKIEIPIPLGYYFYKDTLKCKTPEIVIVKDRPGKFEDILVNSNKYDII